MKILVYPKDNNPYQQLLYKKFTDEITYLSNPTNSHIAGVLLLPLLAIYYRVKGYKIFHLHWVYTFQFTVKNNVFYSPPFKLFFTLYLAIFLLVIKIVGFKLVWTTHDVLPHGNQFINNLFVSRMLALFADAKILHSQSSLREITSLQMNTQNTFIIPIGSYIGVYEDIIHQEAARKKLQIQKNDFVFGFFGRVEYYKGVIELIESFIDVKLKNTKLIIAGPCFNPELKKALHTYASNNPNILLFLQFIPDEEVQIYLNAVDIFVYPFQKITTSSSVMVSMSFHKPVIAPLIGEMVDMPENVGYFYIPAEQALTTKMAHVYKKKKDVSTKGANAYTFAQAQNWNVISKLTRDVYIKLLT